MSDLPLIPRRLLFGNPDRAQVQLSPDGAYLAWLAPRAGVLNVWVAPRTDLDAARPVTEDTGRGIRFYRWAYTPGRLLYLQDKNGDENWRLYGVDVTAGDAIHDLTPFEGVQTQLWADSPDFPAEVLLGLNHRQPQWHDVYRLNILTGELTLVLQHERFLSFTFDNAYQVREALQMTPDGGLAIFTPADGDWRQSDFIPGDDLLTTARLGFDKTNRILYARESRGRNTAALVAIDTATGATQLLAEDAQADVEAVVRHPTEHHVQGVSFVYARQRWQALDPAFEADLARLRTATDGDLTLMSRTLDDRFWVVVSVVDAGSARYYLYDRAASEVRFLFSNRPALDAYPLARMYSAIIPARDGLQLVAYYTLPVDADADGDGIPDRPLPLVFLPHGGPWGRDVWGFHPWHQWLANRGYAVLAVNFRASTGFGKAFVNAGNREWGGAILHDQQDAVQWAIDHGLADPTRIAIMGGSFGGYSVLAGLTFTPELFACGVALVGPSNLITLLESMPPYWRPMLELFTTRVGDHRTEEGRALLTRHSPLTYVERICRPLLIGQGANDPRVKRAESDQIVQALQARNIPVTYLLYPDEGHGFARPENTLSFNAVAEAFLARCLGGRLEPLGQDLADASMQVLAGAIT